MPSTVRTITPNDRKGYVAFPTALLTVVFLMQTVSVHFPSMPLLYAAIVGWVVFYWGFLHMRTNPVALAMMLIIVVVVSAGTAIFVIGRVGGPHLPGYSIVNMEVRRA